MATDIPDMKQIKADTDATSDSIGFFSNIVNKSLQSLQSMSDTLKATGHNLMGLTDGLKAVAQAQKDSIILTQQQANTFGLISTAVLGATKAFDNFGDQKGLNTFGNQIDQLVATASNAKQPLEALSFVAGQLGLNVVKRASDTIETYASNIAKAAKAMIAGADSALKLQNGFLQISAASGNLGRVFEQAGPHLHNLNNLLEQQMNMITSASAATNTSVDTVVKYYGALGKIPGYLTENIRGIESAGHSINMLTAAIRIATATGQTEEEVLGDLSKAYTTYGASGEKALEFTARIAELSQKYNIQIEDTRNFMNDMANSFKFLGENTEATSNVFGEFFNNLRETGLSARSSKDVVDDFGKSIANLTIAQKAFLSARTGGPGGLLGAVQIEREIREGQMDKVAARVRDALRQQFGRIVTQEEGAQSQAGAQEFIRQRMFLQQGPFGQMFGQGAEGEGKATRFLEALAKPGGARQTGAADILREDIRRGTEIANKSDTKLTQVNAELEAIKMFAGITALNTAQNRLTPATRDSQLRQQLLGGIVDAMKSGTEATTRAAKTQQTDTSALDMTRAYKSLMDTVSNSFKSTTDHVKNQTTGRANAPGRKEIDVSIPNLNEPVARAIAHHPAATTAQHPAITEKKEVPTPQNITVHVVSVCPDCHKKFVKDEHQNALTGGVGDLGAGF